MNDQDPHIHRLAHLENEHRDLDDVINKIISYGPFDQIKVQRLKKRNLILKDEILPIRSILIPDSIA